MNKSVIGKILWTFLVITLCYSISYSQKKQKDKRLSKYIPTPSVKVMTSDESAQYLFIEGLKYEMLDNHKDAIKQFLEAEKYQPNSAAIKYKISQCYHFLNQNSKAFEYANKAIALDNRNEHYYNWLGWLYFTENKFDKSSEYMKQAIKIKPMEDYFFQLADIYQNAKQPDNVIKTYEEYEKQYGFDEEVAFQKQKFFLEQNNIDKASAEMERIIKYGENAEMAVVEYIKLLVHYNRYDKAAVILPDYIKQFPESVELQLLALEIKRIRNKDVAGYQNEIKQMLANPALDVQYKINILVDYMQRLYDEKEKAEGLALAQLVAAVHPESSQAKIVLGDFLLANNYIREARNTYRQALKIDGDNYKLWLQLLTITWELAEYDTLIMDSEEGLTLFPTQPLFYFYNGVGYATQKKYQNAMEILEQGLAFTANSKELQIQFHSQLGDIYYNLKKYNLSDESYQTVIKNDNNNIYVLNNWSYYLALRKEKLDIAKDMAFKLVVLAPENPVYLDTYGWVLYVSGKYQEAEEYLRKAVSLSSDATIIEHYGDVLFQLGKKAEAIKFWKKALETGADNPVLLEKKIAEERLIE